MPAVGIAGFGAESRDLDRMPVRYHRDRAVLYSGIDGDSVGEGVFCLLRKRIGADVIVMRNPSHKHIADAPADGICGMTVFLQPPDNVGHVSGKCHVSFHFRLCTRFRGSMAR